MTYELTLQPDSTVFLPVSLQYELCKGNSCLHWHLAREFVNTLHNTLISISGNSTSPLLFMCFLPHPIVTFSLLTSKHDMTWNVAQKNWEILQLDGMHRHLLFTDDEPKCRCCTNSKGKAIPLQALRVLGGWGSQILRQSTHEGGKVVSRTHRPPLPPGHTPGTHFC
jgi:hypothetical protein